MATLSVQNQILAATVDNCTLVAISGSANFKLAPAFKQALQAARLAGSLLIVVDMAACKALDSTFMGALAYQGLASQKPDNPALVVINISAHVAGLLKGLGLDRLLRTYAAGSLPGGTDNLAPLVKNLQPVEAAPLGARDLAALMYDAHETLTHVAPENLQRFKDVLAFLREDLKRL